MPELSRFYEIVVTRYVEVGSPRSLPHIHAKYGGRKAVYSLDGQVLRGGLPTKQHKLMQAWMALHEHELQDRIYSSRQLPLMWHSSLQHKGILYG